MAVIPRSLWLGLGFVLIGSVVQLLGSFARSWAIVAIGLAQPFLAIGLNQLNEPQPIERTFSLIMGWLHLAGLWAIGLGISVVVLTKALIALAYGPSLGAAILFSCCVSLNLVLIWRLWPLWFAIERAPHRWQNGWDIITNAQRYEWIGLGGTVCVSSLGLCGVALTFLDPSKALPQWTLSSAVFILSIVGHWQLQRVRPRRETLTSPAAQIFRATASSDIPARSDEPAQRNDDLFQAARMGRVEQALQWMESGADPFMLPNKDSPDQRSLLMLAAVLPDLRLMQELLDRGVDVNQQHRGLTALLVVTRDSWHGRHAAVQLLLDHGANPRVMDREGNTPLHHAARSIDATVARCLCQAGADCDALNHEGYSPLALAASLGNTPLVRYLLDHGASTDLADGYPALIAAARNVDDDSTSVTLLLDSHADPNAQDRHGRTALHEAALTGNDAIAAQLLGAGAQVDARDHAGRTPFLDAAANAHEKTIACLLAHGADKTATDGTGSNAILLACQAQTIQPALIQSLIEVGIAKETPDYQGLRAIDRASAAGRWSVVSLLDPEYPIPAAAVKDPNESQASLPTPDAPTAVRLGLLTGHHDSLDEWARQCHPSQLGQLLHDPQLSLNSAAVEWLLKRNADAHVENSMGLTPMFALCSLGTKAAASLQVYLRHMICPAEPGVLARLLTAFVHQNDNSHRYEQLSCQLVAIGADGRTPSPEGDHPLHLAVRLGWAKLLETLITHGNDVQVTDRLGMTALHLAAALGREDELKCLIRYGAIPTARTTDGQTPLGVALANGRRDLAYWLDWRDWPLPGRSLDPSDLPSAAMAGDVEAVRRLIDLGLPLDATDAKGCTALLRASGGGQLEVMRLLLDRGASPIAVAHSGATPISAAVSAGHRQAVALLLEQGAPIDQALPGGVTGLMLACTYGDIETVTMLLAGGANVHAIDAQGLTALHCAAHYAFSATDATRVLALLDTLLLAGANPQHCTLDQTPPLLILLGARIEPGTACNEDVLLKSVERFIAELDDVNLVDRNGFGPLHYAALHGLAHVAQFLVRAGVDPRGVHPSARSPRDIALSRGFVDIASLLTPQTQPVASMARFLKGRG